MQPSNENGAEPDSHRTENANPPTVKPSNDTVKLDAEALCLLQQAVEILVDINNMLAEIHQKMP